MPFIARSAVAGVALILAASSGPQAAAKRPVTIDDALHLKGVSGAQLAPDGSRVLFTVRGWEWPENKVEPDKGSKAPEIRSHVWMVATSGSETARQITFGERGESSPAWSPDGKYISFVTARGAAQAGADADGGPKAQIWLMRVDGGEAWKLTDAKEGVASYEWAPDSRKIAYLARDPLPKDVEEARRRKDDERIFEGDHRMQHLWSIEVESKQATQLTTGTDYTVRAMTWAPDSARLAFGAGPTPMIRDERQDLHIVTLATKAIDSIVATPAPESGPRWSPDGTTHCVHDAPARRRNDQSRRDHDPPALQLATDALRCRDQEGPRRVRPQVRQLTRHHCLDARRQTAALRCRRSCLPLGCDLHPCPPVNTASSPKVR